MNIFVIIATKGRTKETRRLLDDLEAQTLPPSFVIIVGTEEKDLEGLKNHPRISDNLGDALISPRIGLTAQRNFAIETLNNRGLFKSPDSRFFCVFFDDDYRPDKNWLKLATERLMKNDCVGLTGQVLADGINSGGLTEEQATSFLNGEKSPQAHWASGERERPIDSAYGCNMAFLDVVIRQTRFDENLPLYGWQEDRDYTGMAKKLGLVIYFPGCRGVHLGVKTSRTSGLKLGYSQIANPIYLMKKGTMGYIIGMKHMARNIGANIIRSFLNNYPQIDYKGRLLGNMRALIDFFLLRLDPTNILFVPPN